MTRTLTLTALTMVFALAAACGGGNAPVRQGANNRDAAIANVKLGVAYMQRGELALAKDKLERAEKQDPRNVEVQTSLAFLMERLNEPDKAEKYYRAAQRLEPNNAEVANNYAVFLCRGGKTDQAVEMFSKAAGNALYRTPWAALTNAGVCLRSAKRSQDAVQYLQNALAIRPNYVEAVLEMGDAQLELGHPDVARIVIERYLTAGAPTPEVLLVGVRAALALGDRATADNYARLLRRNHPNSPQTRALPQLMPGGT
ncbi:MAG: type IV pilus biogenesis/stability protein PilW [Nevskiaceae bacterium]|jgi:type IV pilus assembly protein PilF|nr:type IV pilus biogenesis/stability protein PilW [Nevskiaceae bacterium]